MFENLKLTTDNDST